MIVVGEALEALGTRRTPGESTSVAGDDIESLVVLGGDWARCQMLPVGELGGRASLRVQPWWCCCFTVRGRWTAGLESAAEKRVRVTLVTFMMWEAKEGQYDWARQAQLPKPLLFTEVCCHAVWYLFVRLLRGDAERSYIGTRLLRIDNSSTHIGAPLHLL